MDEDFKKRLASLFGFSYATSAGIQIDTMFSPYINHYVSDIFNGIYHGKSIKSLSYSFPAGKTAIISGLTVIEFSHDLPQMQLVNGMKMWTLDMVHYKCKELDLEGNFQHHFLLYAPEGTQIEDLQIFSPDFMQTIIERFPDIAFECDGNKLYLMQGVQDAIVGHGRISKKSITYFFEEIDFLINKFSKFETEENADVSNSDTVVDKN